MSSRRRGSSKLGNMRFTHGIETQQEKKGLRTRTCSSWVIASYPQVSLLQFAQIYLIILQQLPERSVSDVSEYEKDC